MMLLMMCMGAHDRCQDTFGKSDPFYRLSRVNEDRTTIPMFKSEVIMKTLSPTVRAAVLQPCACPCPFAAAARCLLVTFVCACCVPSHSGSPRPPPCSCCATVTHTDLCCLR